MSRGVAVALLALVPAYCSVDGLVTGDTLAMAKRTHSHSGVAGVVSAISYGFFAAALVIAAIGYLVAGSRRRAALFKWAWNVTIVAIVLFFAGRIVWVMQ